MPEHTGTKMVTPYFQRPKILIVDRDRSRMEHTENQLFRAGFQVLGPVDADAKYAIDTVPDLVLAYAQLEPTVFTDKGIPVLVMHADDRGEGFIPEGNEGLVHHLSHLEVPSAVVESIRLLIEQATAGGSDPPAEAATYLDGDWATFEQWIRTKIGGAFEWSVRPRDDDESREMVADAIAESMRKNDGDFPQRNAFFKRK